MNTSAKAILATVFSIFVGGCAAAMSTGETTVKNDPYKDVAKVTTADYDVSSIGKSDIMLRAFVPKGSQVKVDTSQIGISSTSLDQTSYQVYFMMTASEWNYWDTVRYKINGEVSESSLGRIGSDVDCSQYGCTHYEDVGASISRSELEQIADENGISFRVYSGKYSDVTEDIEISGEEVNDFLQRVDQLEKEVR
jgi:hypothetical protein